MLLSPVPTGVPEMFVAVAGQRQVNFSWSPPAVILRNGVITSYTLSCSPSPSSLPQSPSQSGPLTVAGFSPDTSYSCSVVASNSVGSGPPANITFTTLQDCKFINITRPQVYRISISIYMYVEIDVGKSSHLDRTHLPHNKFRVDSPCNR